ncbi:MAG TPA: thioesterase family protein [Burkholderiales bacterium]|nr:thioesterase family protein [Burkholderiales bacterium]
MTAQKKLLWVEKIKVRWGDMDAMGHVNNAAYFRYMEQARVSWLESLKIRVGASRKGPVIVSANCTFIKAIVYPATLEVSVYGGEAGRSSFPIFHEIYLEDHPEVKFAEGEVTVVWIDHELGKSIPLPEELRTELQI